VTAMQGQLLGSQQPHDSAYGEA